MAPLPSTPAQSQSQSQSSTPHFASKSNRGKGHILAQPKLNFTVSSTSKPSDGVGGTAPNLQVTTNNVCVMKDCMSDVSVAGTIGMAQGDTAVNAAVSHPTAVTSPNTSRSSKSWSDIVNEADCFVSNTPVLSHKPEVAPIFLNFQ